MDSTLLSNETLLATTVDPYVDGITVSYVNPDPKAFVFSASQDPGENSHRIGRNGIQRFTCSASSCVRCSGMQRRCRVVGTAL